MLAQVVVVDLGEAVDPRRHRFHARRWHGERHQGAGAGAAVLEDGADPGKSATAFQLLKAGEDLFFAAIQRLGHGAVGLGAQRHAVLETVDQAAAEAVQLHVTTPSRGRGC